jgi:hypothetical protein
MAMTAQYVKLKVLIVQLLLQDVLMISLTA